MQIIKTAVRQEDRKFRLKESFLQPYYRKGDNFASIFARSVYLTKYSRDRETWTDTIRRVVEGSASLSSDVSETEAELLFHLFWSGQALPPGRGLWVGGIDGILADARFNCWFVTLRSIDDWCWAANQLMLGGGVGVGLCEIDSMPVVSKKECRFAVWCKSDHENLDEVGPNGKEFLNGATPVFRIPDSREGWVEALRLVLTAAYEGQDFIVDVSDIRPRGRPIRTFGGIACGPGPLVNLLRAVWDVVRGGAGRRLKSVECLDITNYIGLCIKSGNVRRSAIIQLGRPDDQDFRNAKKDYEKVGTHRHTSNNSIAFTSWKEIETFDWRALVEDLAVMGEPGLVNMPLVWKTDPFARGFNPCFSGDTLIAVADGRNAVSIRQLAEEGKDVPVYSMDKKTGKVEIKMGRHPRVTGHQKKLVRVWLDDGSHIDTTPDHKFILLDGSTVLAKDLKHGASLPRFTKRLEEIKKRGKKYYLVHGDTKNYRKSRFFEHRLIAKFHSPVEWDQTYQNCKKNGFADTGGLVVHHKDYNPLNNAPENLQIMTFRDHAKLHGDIDNSGEKNGNWSGVSSADIRTKALELTQTLGRRFSSNDWDQFALEQGLPRQFSAFRVGELGSVFQLSQWCAAELGFEHIGVDPRVVKTYQSMLDQGYDAHIQGGDVLVTKTCEGCASTFEVEHAYRERSFCSMSCGDAYINGDTDVKATRVEKMHDLYRKQMQPIKTEQARVASALKFQLGREPNRKEWSNACKAESIPSRIGPTLKFGYRQFSDVLEAASNYNHKVVRVEDLAGDHTVYNITVDDHHTVAVITQTREKGGENEFFGIYLSNCGEQALHDREACNLAEVFPANFEEGTDPHVALRLVTRYCLRQRLTPLSDPTSHAVGQRNMRVGVGLGGLCDFEWSPYLLGDWFMTCRREANDYAKHLGVSRPITVTTVKPSGCRPWYALTSTDQGILTLEELFEGHENGEQWCDVSTEVRALQQSGDSSRITKTYDNGKATVLRIRLACGLEVESTENHQWWVKGRHDHKMVDDARWVRADQIRIGDVLEVNLGVYNKASHTPLVPLNRLTLHMRGDATDIRQPSEMNPDLAWLLGYMRGDGTMSPSKYRLRYVDEHVCHLEKAQRILFDQFGLHADVHKASEGRNASTLEVGSKMLWHWLIRNDVFKYHADQIDLIPSVVRRSSREDIIAFIAGLIDSDGGAYGSKGQVKFMTCTKDSDFARHLQNVAWSVGLGVGRSLNDEGESFQAKREMWHLTSNHFVDPAAFALLHRHSVKCSKFEVSDFYWTNAKANRRTLGKVEAIESLGEMPTYDIEVENTHWYYAGAVKSHNTISLLNGSSPGIHAPYAPYYIRRTRIAKNDPMAPAMIEAGVPYEDCHYDKTGHTWVFAFPMKARHTKMTVVKETIRDQFERQAQVQEWWADNAVSATLSFQESEKAELEQCFKEYVPKFKSTSCLSKSHGYVQAPYSEIDEATYKAMYGLIDHENPLVRGGDFELDECSGGVCPLK